MSDAFPEFTCPYSKKLAEKSRRFALQVYDPKGVAGADSEDDAGLCDDPFGELSTASKCHGLRQRFPDRVLVMAANSCFMNCRHCTRRGILGRSEIVDTPKRLAECVAYVRRHRKVRDVLLSGGDILTLSDAKVMEFVDAFAALPQIDIVRVCTRAPCVNPSRITPNLATLLARTKKVWVNTQFNCADELTPEAVKACALLIDKGIPVSCQSVLLKGVNDSTTQMLRLLKALSAARIRPYYVFMCDPVRGIGRFRVPVEKARKIELECAKAIGGLSMPRFVADIPSAPSKIPIADLLP